MVPIMIHVAQYGIIITHSLILVFHCCIILKIIPYNIVWGGRLKSDTEMVRFETVSILINLFFLLVLLVHSNILTVDYPKIIMKIILWIMMILFAINTLGNMVSKNKLEQRLFTPITIMLSIFSLILALTT